MNRRSAVQESRYLSRPKARLREGMERCWPASPSAGNHEVGIRHWKIVSEAGYKLSLDNIKAIFGKRLDALMKAARGGAQGS